MIVSMPYNRWEDPKFQQAYLMLVSEGAQNLCAPYWWSGPKGNILHNGTICYVDTGTAKIGITANHVVQQYLDDLEEFGEDEVECQLAGSTIYPEQRLIDRSKALDIATLDLPDVFVMASRKKSYHAPPTWPNARAEKGQIVLYGGYPGVLRSERGAVAELPFQWVGGRISDGTDQNIILEPSFATMRWQGQETNGDPGGWSGGPVFRSVENTAIARLELVGIIYDFPYGDIVRARHADVVLADGSLRHG